MFIKTVFEATVSFSNILYITQATLNQIDNIKSFTSDMRFNVMGLTCGFGDHYQQYATSIGYKKEAHSSDKCND